MRLIINRLTTLIYYIFAWLSSLTNLHGKREFWFIFFIWIRIPSPPWSHTGF